MDRFLKITKQKTLEKQKTFYKNTYKIKTDNIEITDSEHLLQNSNLSGNDIFYLQEYLNLSSYDWLVEVMTLEAGNSFGELALIDDKPRQATI